MVSPFKCKKNILIPQYILLVRFIRQGEQSTAPESVVRRLSARLAQGVEKTTRVKCSPPPHSPFLPRKLLKPITLCHNLISTALQAVSDAFQPTIMEGNYLNRFFFSSTRDWGGVCARYQNECLALALNLTVVLRQSNSAVLQENLCN